MKFATSSALLVLSAAAVSAAPLQARDTRYNAAIPTTGSSDQDGPLSWAVLAEPDYAPTTTGYYIPPSGTSDDEGPLVWAVLGADPIYDDSPYYTSVPTSTAQAVVQTQTVYNTKYKSSTTIVSIPGHTSTTTSYRTKPQTLVQAAVKTSTSSLPFTLHFGFPVQSMTTTTSTPPFTVKVGIPLATAKASSSSAGGVFGFLTNLGLGRQATTVTSAYVQGTQTITDYRTHTTSTPVATVTVPGHTSTYYITQHAFKAGTYTVDPRLAQQTTVRAVTTSTPVATSYKTAKPSTVVQSSTIVSYTTKASTMATVVVSKSVTSYAYTSIPGRISTVTSYRQPSSTVTAHYSPVHV